MRPIVEAHNEAVRLAIEAPLTSPDPILTANLYCHNALDNLVAHAIVPFREHLRDQGFSDVSFWLLRYGKGGEHLKIRIHGFLENRTSLRCLLERSVETAWAQIPPLSVERPSLWRGAPPVDEEDMPSEDHTDRTLIWTHYRRSPVSLGGLLENDSYVSLVTGCLAAGCDRVLDVFQEHGSFVSPSRKQRALTAIIVEALAAMDESSSFRERYLAYHRDSLFRFLIAPSDEPEERALKLSTLCEEHLVKVQDPGQVLSTYMRETLSSSCDAPTAWHHKISVFHQWISNPQNLDCRLDPFAWDPRFIPLFKILHGVSNQLGIRPLNEGFIYHLLLATMGAETQPVELYPDWEWVES